MSGEEKNQADEMLYDLRKAVEEKNIPEIKRNLEDFENEFYFSRLTDSQEDYIINYINEVRELLNNKNQ